MDIFTAEEVKGIADELEEKSREYYAARKNASQSKLKLDIILAANLKELRKIRSNIGYEMALIYLLEDGSEEIAKYYKTYTQETDRYKALERILDALKTKISLAQSIMRWEQQNT